MYRNKIKPEPLLIKLIRIFTGLVFIFSSTVKGIDPIGTAYRVEDYLLVYGWTSMLDYALLLGVFLIIVEFLIGFALVFRLKSNIAGLGVLLIMAVFTVITYLDARYNMVPDCGCFGDAVKLTNWQTFYKNIFLIVLALIIFIYRKRMKIKMPCRIQWAMLVIFVGLYAGFVIHSYRHLPIMDFRDWKVGNDMKAEGLDLVKTYVKYRNIETGEEQEFLSPDYPWNDSIWMSQWTFVNQRIDDSQRILKHGVMLEDTEGNDWTMDIVENPEFQLILISWDLQEASHSGLSSLRKVIDEANELNIPIVLITSSTSDIIEKYLNEYQLDVETLFADDIELKAMIRSNPGLVLMHNGIVIQKWPFRNFPDKTALESFIHP
jgi:uncharacterized membrane protein YphA (DoxX/SURF4 family)